MRNVSSTPSLFQDFGDLILKGGKYYRVSEVIFDDDEGDIIVEVFVDTDKTSAEDLFKDVPKRNHGSG